MLKWSSTKGGQESDRRGRKNTERERQWKKKAQERDRGVVNSFSDRGKNVTNPEVVASLCAMIPGGIVKA